MWCDQSRPLGTSASRWNKVTRCVLCYENFSQYFPKLVPGSYSVVSKACCKKTIIQRFSGSVGFIFQQFIIVILLAGTIDFIIVFGLLHSAAASARLYTPKCEFQYFGNFLKISNILDEKISSIEFYFSLLPKINLKKKITFWSGLTDAILPVSWSVVVPRLHLHS